jgi:integrase
MSALPLRDGTITLADLIDVYMQHYAGRDTTRTQRLTWWKTKAGHVALQDLSDDEVHAAVESLATQHSRYFAGKDADEKPIYRAKKKALSPATLNRYVASLGAVVTWAIRKRIAPKGYVHPCRAVERRAENNEKTRYLSADERKRLLEACKASKWPRLYLLVLLALTTGARKGELIGLHWEHLDVDQGVAHVGRSKNGDPKTLPLVPAVLEEMLRLCGTPAQPAETLPSTGLVFPSARRPEQAYAFEGRFAEALKAAHIRGFRFHDLRHTCASMLAQSGATLLEIGDLLGHRQLQVTKRYSHLAAGHKRELVTRVLGDIR